MREKFDHSTTFKYYLPTYNLLEERSVLSISFEVDVPTEKVGGSPLIECQRHKLPRGVWGHAPPGNFKI